MNTNRIRNIHWDSHVREGIEYIDSFWRLIPKFLRMSELERELELAMLIKERHELHRRCVDNDKPGKRHMLPFVWRRRYGIGGALYGVEQSYVDIQEPLRVGNPHYNRAMDMLEEKIKAVRRG